MPETKQFAGMEGDNQSDSSLKANFVLQNRYKILGVLGSGGMGTVYQARDLMFTEAKRLVAIKEMQTTVADPNLKQTMLKTFQREANILASLSHPAIPKIFDFFNINDRAYLVQEYINGRDLEALLAQTKQLPVEKVIEWSLELCDALSYLHTQQPDPVVFRDMKPSNVMIDNLGKVRLIDFGIAKQLNLSASANQKHTMIGTEGYCAPEQYKGEASPLSDLYGLGATLHHILTRKDPRLEPPFSFNERPIPNYNDTVPTRFVSVIEKALSFNVAERFQSATEMKSAIEDAGFRSLNMAASTTTNGKVNGNSSEGTNFFEDETSLGRGTLQPKWEFKTEDEIRSTPVSYREYAYIGSYDTNMWAIKLDSGEQVWKYPTKAGIASSPLIDETNKNIIFGSEDFSLYAVDYRSGRFSWSYQTKDRIRCAPRLAHDHIFFGSDDGKVYALGAVNGRFLWAFDTAAPVRSRPYVTNELVIVASFSGEMFALSLSGQRKWSLRTRGNIISAPYVEPNEGICYIGSADTFVYAIDVNSGVTSWRFRTGGPVISSPVEYKGLLYFGSTDGYFYAINAQSSRERWKFNVGKAIVSSPVVHKGAVYFGGTDNYLYCLDAETGKERWKYQTGGSITSAPCVAGDLLLVGSMDHILYAFPLVT
jgi:serine/threonine protein kinase